MWGKGVMYRASSQRATDISLHLGKACYPPYILLHWGVQLILAYSWTKPALLAASKDRGGMFLFLLFFHLLIFLFRTVPRFYLLYNLFYLSLFCLSSPFL